MDVEDLIICLAGYIVLASGWIWFPHGSPTVPDDFHTIRDDFQMIRDNFHTIHDDLHNSDRQAASVTHFGSHFAHPGGILEANGSQSVAPDPQK